jgi:hypothetical protein
MADLKYNKYIVDYYKPRDTPASKANADRVVPIVRMDEEIIKGSFYMGLVWALQPPPPNVQTEAHVHDYNEVIGFIGSDWKNPQDLGGEIEFWIEDEKYILKKSCIIFIPKGIKHCPLRDLKIDRPYIHFAMVTEGQYKR